MMAILGYIGSSRQRVSLGKGIAAWIMLAVMQLLSAMLSIGGACEGDNFN